MNVDKLQFIDLGLPSGRLWANENIKNGSGKEAHFTFDDAVNTFGKNLPSKEDWKELFDNSTYKWNKKRKGYDVTGPNGNTIFLPAAGFCGGDIVVSVGSYGHYWSASVCDESRAFGVFFSSGYLYPQDRGYRYDGFSVRLVR